MDCWLYDRFLHLPIKVARKKVGNLLKLSQHDYVFREVSLFLGYSCLFYRQFSANYGYTIQIDYTILCTAKIIMSAAL